MQLVPGADRVVCHICIQCMEYYFLIRNITIVFESHDFIVVFPWCSWELDTALWILHKPAKSFLVNQKLAFQVLISSIFPPVLMEILSVTLTGNNHEQTCNSMQTIKTFDLWNPCRSRDAVRKYHRSETLLITKTHYQDAYFQLAIF